MESGFLVWELMDFDRYVLFYYFLLENFYFEYEIVSVGM